MLALFLCIQGRALSVCTCTLNVIIIVALRGIIQLFSHCIAMWYAMSRSPVKLTAIGISWGRGVTVTQKLINIQLLIFLFFYEKIEKGSAHEIVLLTHRFR